MANYFKVTPPVVLTLEKKGFIFRVPGEARSIELRLKRAQLPDLECGTLSPLPAKPLEFQAIKCPLLR